MIHIHCAQEHLVRTVLEPYCPNCRVGWTELFVAENFPHGWRHGIYKEHEENVLLDIEKTRLPENQAAVATELRERKRRKHLREIRENRNDLWDSLFKYDHRHSYRDREILTLQIQEYDTIIEAIQRGCYDFDTRTILPHVPRPEEETPVRVRAMTRKCPVVDCRGFLDDKWKCQICLEQICHKCGDIEVLEHVCKEDTLATFQLIRFDSKCCPKCGTAIMKISGCDHMFCVECKTAFCWKTMEIHSSGNSNPLYWQWFSARGAAGSATGDVCSISGRVAHLLLQRAREMSVRVRNLLESLPHLEEIRQRIQQRSTEDTLSLLRVQYLVGDLSEIKWKHKIHLLVRNQKRDKYISDIVDLFIRGSLDIVESSQTQQAFDETENLRKLCNAELGKVTLLYRCPPKFISTVYILQGGPE